MKFHKRTKSYEFCYHNLDNSIITREELNPRSVAPQTNVNKSYHKLDKSIITREELIKS